MLVMGADGALMSLVLPSSSLLATYILPVVVLEGHTERWPPTPVAFAPPATLAALVCLHPCILCPRRPGIYLTSSIVFVVWYSRMWAVRSRRLVDEWRRRCRCRGSNGPVVVRLEFYSQASICAVSPEVRALSA
jgi:hypothetical protein